MTGRLVVMGSGETAPTMVEVHRAALRAAGDGPVLLLDTPYGFQANADELTRRTVAYFARNVGRAVTPLGWRSRLPGAELDHALAAIHRAAAVYAGPGSPTYALRQWAGTGLAAALADVVRRGGTVTFSSAAALTLGVVTVPVYEIYKCGFEPFWAEGLDVLGALTGHSAAVVPHFDNTEGGTHDTRFCYLGEDRLRVLEAELPPGAGVLGVDEHTALVLDRAAGTAAVLGHGAATVRVAGTSRVLPAGSAVPIPELFCSAGAAGAGAAPAGTAPAGTAPARTAPAGPGTAGPSAGTASAATSVRQEADAARARFDAALAGADADAAGEAALGLEEALQAWGADPTQSADTDHARRALRGMLLTLADVAGTGLADPRERLAPLVGELLRLRDKARAERDFRTADAIRDRLAATGIAVRDTAAGTDWMLSG